MPAVGPATLEFVEKIMTFTGQTLTSWLLNELVRELEEEFSGEILRPGDAEYEAARWVRNTAVDRHPALIVRPLTAKDVARAVTFAREHDLALAVRGGGHSPAGHSTVDGGIVLDLTAMNGIEVNRERREAWLGAGLTWGEFYARKQDDGLAIPGGDVSSVGVAGLTLGGGMGWLARKYGMAIDNLLAVEVVTADGRTLTASEAEHADLFWSLPGCGGNFGVATRFRFRMYPVGTVLGGAIVYPASREMLRAYLEAASAAPDELTAITLVLNAPPLPFIPKEAHGTPVLSIVPCYVGDLAAGQAALAPLRSLAGQSPLADVTGPKPYPELFELTKVAAVSRPQTVRAGFLRELPDAVIEAMLAAVREATSPFCTIAFRVLGGTMSRVSVEATAFAHRDKSFFLAFNAGWEDGDEAPRRHVAWTRDLWGKADPFTDGAYANYLEDEGDERVRAAYPGATYDRLAEIKRRYDPENVFRLNVNIPPAGA